MSNKESLPERVAKLHSRDMWTWGQSSGLTLEQMTRIPTDVMAVLKRTFGSPYPDANTNRGAAHYLGQVHAALNRAGVFGPRSDAAARVDVLAKRATEAGGAA